MLPNYPPAFGDFYLAEIPFPFPRSRWVGGSNKVNLGSGREPMVGGNLTRSEGCDKHHRSSNPNDAKQMPAVVGFL